MSIPELIESVLEQLENQFYAELPRRQFNVDLPYLLGALGTYGHECAERGWELDADFIYNDLSGILQSFKRSGVAIEWMPNYLQHAIRQHIREHAEELSRKARSMERLAARVVGGVAPVVVIEKKPVELLGAIYRDVNRLRRQAHAMKKRKTAEQRRQGQLI